MHCLLTPALELIKANKTINSAQQKWQKRVAGVVSTDRKSSCSMGGIWVSSASNPTFNRSFEISQDESAGELQDLHAQLLKSATKMQQKLAATTSHILTITSFGALVPVLLLLAPLSMFLNMRAGRWIAHAKERPFGVEIAEQILVHPPFFLLRNLGHVLNIVIMIFIFIDLQVPSTPLQQCAN